MLRQVVPGSPSDNPTPTPTPQNRMGWCWMFGIGWRADAPRVCGCLPCALLLPKGTTPFMTASNIMPA